MKHVTLIIASFLFALSLSVGIMSWGMVRETLKTGHALHESAGIFPFFIAVILCFVLLWKFFADLKAANYYKFLKKGFSKKALLLQGMLIFLYIFAMLPFGGFVISGIVYCASSMFLAKSNFIISFIISTVFVLLLYLIFSRFFYIQLP